jgi:MYXO-CTERM domain-containing protein
MVEIRRKTRPTKDRIVSNVIKGTVRSKTLPGVDEAKVSHEILVKDSIARKKGTEVAISYEPDSDDVFLSTLSGAVDFDNIDYVLLPSVYFTDPGDPCADTLNLDLLMSFTDDTTGLFDILAAGNAVEVGAGYYSSVASPPLVPMLGKAPIHEMEGGLSPEPMTLALLGLGVPALLRRRRR